MPEQEPDICVKSNQARQPRGRRVQRRLSRPATLGIGKAKSTIKTRQSQSVRKISGKEKEIGNRHVEFKVHSVDGTIEPGSQECAPRALTVRAAVAGVSGAGRRPRARRV